MWRSKQAGGKFTPRSSGEADRHCHRKLGRLELQRRLLNCQLFMQYSLQYVLISFQTYFQVSIALAAPIYINANGIVSLNAIDFS